MRAYWRDKEEDTEVAEAIMARPASGGENSGALVLSRKKGVPRYPLQS